MKIRVFHCFALRHRHVYVRTMIHVEKPTCKTGISGKDLKLEIRINNFLPRRKHTDSPFKRTNGSGSLGD